LRNLLEVRLGVNVPIISLLEGHSIARLSAQILEQLTCAPLPAARQEPPRAAEGECPLSHGQAALWYLHQLDPDSVAYNVNLAARIGSDVDVPALGRALQGLVDRHPALRTTFTGRFGEPVQRLHERVELNLDEIDAAAWGRDDCSG